MFERSYMSVFYGLVFNSPYFIQSITTVDSADSVDAAHSTNNAYIVANAVYAARTSATISDVKYIVACTERAIFEYNDNQIKKNYNLNLKPICISII